MRLLIKWSKPEFYLRNTNIWHHLFVKRNVYFNIWIFSNMCIWHPELYIYRGTHYWLAIHFDEIPSCIVYLWLLCIIKWQMVDIGKFFCIILIFGTIFGEKIGYLTPGVPVCKVIHYCLSIHLEEIPSFFVLYVFLWLLCIIKWSKLGS